MGLTPYLGLIEYFDSIKKLKNVYLLYSVKYESDFIYFDYLKKKLGNQVKFFVTQDDSSNHINRRFTIADVNQFSSKKDNVYVCGSIEFNTNVSEMLKKDDYFNIHIDYWD